MNSIFSEIDSSQHWDEQVSLLQQIPLNESSARLLNDSKNAMVIKNLLSTQKPKLIMGTVEFLLQIFEGYGPILHSFALNIMSSDCLFKLLNSPAKIMSTSAHELIKCIIVHSPHSKYYSFLAPELSSKNMMVRQCVLSYLLVLCDLMQFPQKLMAIVEKMNNDPHPQIRTKSKQLLQAIRKMKKGKKSKVMDKQNSNSHVHSKLNDKKDGKDNKLNPNKSLVQLSQSQIIMNSFSNDAYEAPDEIGIEFLVKKINSKQAWNIKVIAIQEFIHFVSNFTIPPSHSKICMQLLVQLLSQRRNHVNELIPQILVNLIEKEEGMKSLLKNMGSCIMQQAIKQQKAAFQLIPMVIEMDPIKYIIEGCQMSIELKSIKQKALMLDILVQSICQHYIPSSKVSVIVKMLCRLFQKYFTHKEIYLPAMAILSHFKAVHPQELLSCLLCQGNEVLNRIVSIAEDIDPSLGDKILNYIRGLKGSNDKGIKNSTEMEEMEVDYLEIPQLWQGMERVKQNQQGCIQTLASVIFNSFQALKTSHFVALLKLPEFILCEANLLQMQLLLQQLCKTENHDYLQALFTCCKHNSSQGKIYDEYTLCHVKKIKLFMEHAPYYRSVSYCERLLNIYRYSKNPKIRLACIKMLTQFEKNLIQECSFQKQKQLIEAQCQLYMHRE